MKIETFEQVNELYRKGITLCSGCPFEHSASCTGERLHQCNKQYENIKLYDYHFIFVDVNGSEYAVIHWKEITPKEFNRRLNDLKTKYKVSESTMLLNWIK